MIFAEIGNAAGANAVAQVRVLLFNDQWHHPQSAA